MGPISPAPGSVEAELAGIQQDREEEKVSLICGERCAEFGEEPTTPRPEGAQLRKPAAGGQVDAGQGHL
jgi:hypothetical protein